MVHTAETKLKVPLQYNDNAIVFIKNTNEVTIQ